MKRKGASCLFPFIQKPTVMICLAIDDEPLALSIIKNFSEKIPFITKLETCSSGIEALEYIKEKPVDLIFLDINMPHISGIEFARILETPPMIIFTTAYQDYALTGFDLSAIDYLVKPFSFERFLKAVNKAYELFLLKGNTFNKPVSDNYIMVKVEYSTIKILLDDILFVEGLKDYIKIYTDGKNYVTKSTMKNIEEKLPPALFMRTHKSFIINLDKVSAFENNHIILSGHKLPLGNQYREQFMAFLDKNKI